MSPEGTERHTPARGGASAGSSGAAELTPSDLSESELVARFWARVRLLAARRLGGPTAAEDVAQETLRRVVEALRQDRLRNPAALPAFVFQTARNVCLQRHRSARREARALDRLRGWRSGRQSGADPLVGLVLEERRDRVRGALERLSESDRELLRMSYYDEVGTAEVARQLGITPRAVRVRRQTRELQPVEARSAFAALEVAIPDGLAVVSLVAGQDVGEGAHREAAAGGAARSRPVVVGEAVEER